MIDKQTQISDLLKGLGKMEGEDRVKVDISEGGRSIWIYHPNEYEHSLYVVLRWSQDHYIGYFADSDWNEMKAQFSLWSILDAGYFASAYSLLVGLRARREEHL
jgi:hypothetical protein